MHVHVRRRLIVRAGVRVGHQVTPQPRRPEKEPRQRRAKGCTGLPFVGFAEVRTAPGNRGDARGANIG